MWVLGWWTKVAVRPDGVVIDNVIVRQVIPAAQFGGFVLDSGIWIRAKDDRRFWLFGYGGSLLGEITATAASGVSLAGWKPQPL
jgi:hypothetical protein